MNRERKSKVKTKNSCCCCFSTECGVCFFGYCDITAFLGGIGMQNPWLISIGAPRFFCFLLLVCDMNNLWKRKAYYYVRCITTWIEII